MEHSPYLDQPAKPCPQFLRGDTVLMGSPPVVKTCRHVQWKHGRWVYYWARTMAEPSDRRPGRPAKAIAPADSDAERGIAAAGEHGGRRMHVPAVAL